MRGLFIDPGTTQSAWVLYACRLGGALVGRPLNKGMCSNEELLEIITKAADDGIGFLVIEQIASYGMAVGKEVFETVFWSGRFAERGLARGMSVDRMPRKDVKMALCHSTKAKDGNVRQALIDLWGGKERAIGKKASPGPLYGFAEDRWAALALAVAWDDTTRVKGPEVLDE